MELISYDNGHILNRTINYSLKLYSEAQNDNLIIDYGDSIQETINLTSSKSK